MQIKPFYYVVFNPACLYESSVRILNESYLETFKFCNISIYIIVICNPLQQQEHLTVVVGVQQMN